jgi:hypothetical protein
MARIKFYSLETIAQLSPELRTGDQPNPTRRPTPEGDAIIAQFGLKKWRVLGPVIVVIVLQGYLLWTLNRTQNGIVLEPNGVRKPFLFAEFLAGVSLYFYREILPWGRWCAFAALAVSVILPSLGQYGAFLASAPVAYATVCFGVVNPSRRLLRGADYSCGNYLYGLVVQQTTMYLFPMVRVWYLNVLSLPIAILVAASWHFVERPANGLRWGIKRIEEPDLAFRMPEVRARSGGQRT